MAVCIYNACSILVDAKPHERLNRFNVIHLPIVSP